MNFEELLETRDARKTTKVRLPYGYFYKRLIDGKYSNFVEFHDEVADHVAFSSCVRREAEEMSKLDDRRQLKFTPNEGGDGVYAIAVEVGHYLTFEQLLNENPAIVARKNFISSTISDLVDLTTQLNDKNIFHVCFAPSNVLVRKSGANVRLLCHGSYYMKLEQDVLYDGVEDFVAPEVFAEGTVDARTDVYSLGKFVAWLYQSGGIPFELKGVLAKATAQSPDDRYASVKDFHQALLARQSMRRTGLVGVAALLIALLAVGCYFYLLPTPEVIEYVKPVDEPIPDDMVDDESLLLDIGADADSATIAAAVQQQAYLNDSLSVDERKMREYQAKAEQIFRKQFTRAADQILSKIYNNEKMNLTEKDSLARSRAMTEELAKKEAELAKEANLGNDRSQRIASEIIDQLTSKKMKELDPDYMGIHKKPSDDDKTINTTVKNKK